MAAAGDQYSRPDRPIGGSLLASRWSSGWSRLALRTGLALLLFVLLETALALRIPLLPRALWASFVGTPVHTQPMELHCKLAYVF